MAAGADRGPIIGAARDRPQNESARYNLAHPFSHERTIIPSFRSGEKSAVGALGRVAGEKLRGAEAAAGVKLSAAARRAVLSALGKRDPEAEACRDGEGNPGPDTELRDTETVPLSEDVDAHIAREVLPHVPDARARRPRRTYRRWSRRSRACCRMS